MDECSAYGPMLATSMSYILGSSRFDAEDHHQALALLSQRCHVQMEFAHPLAIRFIDVAISKHLCTCIQRAENGSWTHILYPSEPFLAHVVACVLNMTGESDVLLASLEIGRAHV